jgi:hypothetical protein
MGVVPVSTRLVAVDVAGLITKFTVEDLSAVSVVSPGSETLTVLEMVAGAAAATETVRVMAEAGVAAASGPGLVQVTA